MLLPQTRQHRCIDLSMHFHGAGSEAAAEVTELDVRVVGEERHQIPTDPSLQTRLGEVSPQANSFQFQ